MLPLSALVIPPSALPIMLSPAAAAAAAYVKPPLAPLDFILPTELAQLLVASADGHGKAPQLLPQVLLLDCRTTADYARGHIVGAVPSNTSPLILRRMKRLTILAKDSGGGDSGGGTAEVSLFLQRAQAARQVIVYDRDTAATAALSLATVLQAAGARVALLQGGYVAVEAQQPHLCLAGPAPQQRSWQPCTERQQTIPRQLHQHVAKPLGCATAINLPDTTLRLNMPPASSHAHTRGMAPTPHAPEASCVLPFLLVGGERDVACGVESLQRRGVTHVLALNEAPLPAAVRHCAFITSLQVPLADSATQDLLLPLPRLLAFIHDAARSGGRVLVHCTAGISRSAAVTIAYLMTHGSGVRGVETMTLQQAYALLKAARSCVSPNLNFMGQLVALEADLARRWQHHGSDPDSLQSLPLRSPPPVVVI